MSIAEQGSDNSFFSEFIDDYFAESEEHLTILRRGLLALESFVNKPQIERALLDEIFRSFHSLKGISGMVGVREAEQLAHEMESYLRALRHDQATLSEEGMEGLMAGTKMLEQVISAKREQKPPPDIASVIAQIESTIPNDAHAAPRPSSPGGEASAAEAPRASDEAPAAREEGSDSRIWRFEFIPSTELSARGINVNTVRARLQELGELRNGAPRVMPGGGIAFEFIVASQADEPTLAALREGGLTCEPYEEPPAIPDAKEADRKEAGDLRPEAASVAPAIAPSNVVRVSLGRLDELMRMVGELVISRARLEGTLKNAEREMPATRWRALQETNLMIERQLRDLREGVMRVRMVPVAEIFERMRFVVRDLAREYRKKVNLDLSGQETEIDKLLIERMMDPLLHLVRNAISHGLETPSEREAIGKRAEGTISLRAFTAAERVVIEVEDDGRGIDFAKVADRAREMGLIADKAKLDTEALLDLICSPGFSTRDEADRASGRGVGMAVVKNTVLGLGGEFTLDSEVGRGTRFTIQLPITLAIADALIVSTGGQKFAVPQSSVREVMEIDPSSVTALEEYELIQYRGGALPIVRLARLFDIEEKYERVFHAFVIGSGLNVAGIAVDRIIGHQEIVVRAINDPLIQVAGISGATELGDGQVVLILDAAALIKLPAPGTGLRSTVSG
ncbi:MAG TPA: chemotaxis protein CheA [Blastocatellia bacterium]|nr:chemotaxis protein CheA [Blastocatellia bacterium]